MPVCITGLLNWTKSIEDYAVKISCFRVVDVFSVTSMLFAQPMSKCRTQISLQNCVFWVTCYDQKRSHKILSHGIGYVDLSTVDLCHSFRLSVCLMQLLQPMTIRLELSRV